MEPLRAAAPADARFILVTATLPEAVYEALLPLFPGLVPVLGPGEGLPGTLNRFCLWNALQHLLLLRL